MNLQEILAGSEISHLGSTPAASTTLRPSGYAWQATQTRKLIVPDKLHIGCPLADNIRILDLCA